MQVLMKFKELSNSLFKQMVDVWQIFLWIQDTNFSYVYQNVCGSYQSQVKFSQRLLTTKFYLQKQ